MITDSERQQLTEKSNRLRQRATALTQALQLVPDQRGPQLLKEILEQRDSRRMTLEELPY